MPPLWIYATDWVLVSTPNRVRNIYAASLDVNAAAGRNKKRITYMGADIVLSADTGEPRDRGRIVLSRYDMWDYQPETAPAGTT